MAHLGQQFNANEHQPLSDISPIPKGEYIACITDSEMKPTKDNSGQYLALTFQVLEGEYKDRFLWGNLNLMNRSPKAVEIAQRELSAICHAVNVMNVQDSEQLHNIPMQIKVKLIPAQGQYQEKNEISAYNPIQGQAYQQSASQVSQTPTGQQQAYNPMENQPGTPPWQQQQNISQAGSTPQFENPNQQYGLPPQT